MERVEQGPVAKHGEDAAVVLEATKPCAEGKPTAMDVLDRESGTVPADVAKRLDGVHVVPMVWEPWWSAGPIADGPLGALTLEIETLGTACTGGSDLELPARVRLRDAKGVLALERAAAFWVHKPHIVFAELELEDPELARRLRLPQTVQDSLETDPFELMISLSADGLRVRLSSRSMGSACTLAHGAVPERSACEKRFSDLIMSEHGPLRDKPLREQLVPGFAPGDAIAALTSRELAIQVPGSDQMTRLHVHYEPDEHACVTENEAGYKLAIALHATLRSEDGRWRVRLGGFAETSVAHDGRWDGAVDVQLDHTALASLTSQERTGFDTPNGGLALLTGSLHAPISSGLPQQLELLRCSPGERVPPYPNVADPSRRRVSCFCNSGHERAVAEIHGWRPAPSESPKRPPRRDMSIAK